MNKPLQILQHQDSNGHVANVKSSNGTAAVFFMPMMLLHSDVFAEPAHKLNHALNGLVAALNSKQETMNEVGVRQAAPDLITATIQKPVQGLMKAGIERIKALTDLKAGWLNMQKTDPATDTEIRALLRDMKAADAMKFVLSTPEVASAAIRNWNLTGLPDTVRESVENTLILDNLANRFASQTQVKPTVHDMLASGPDMGAAKDKAQQAVSNLKTSWQEIDSVRATLESAVNFTAVVASMNVGEAFALLSEAA